MQCFLYINILQCCVYTAHNTHQPLSINLTDPPQWLHKLHNLTHLVLRHNALTCIPAALSHLPQLIHLDLCGNQLTTVDVDVLALVPHLQYVASSCAHALSPCRCLCIYPSTLVPYICLHMATSHLPVSPPISLRHLDISNNAIPNLPPSLFSTLQALTMLNAEGNTLRTLPVQVSQATALHALHVGGNYLTSLPPYVCGGVHTTHCSCTQHT